MIRASTEVAVTVIDGTLAIEQNLADKYRVVLIPAGQVAWFLNAVRECAGELWRDGKLGDGLGPQFES